MLRSIPPMNVLMVGNIASAVDVYERLCGRYTFLGSAHPDQPGMRYMSGAR
jgi:hypothetical protein